jgi:thiosulfate reductase cytochrome b subunit
MQRIYLFKRFERFWHWAQALLVIFMLFTGFAIHGSYHVIPWQWAQQWHTTAAWVLICLWVFAIFWHFTTGEWKQYVPTTDKLVAVAKYYAFGIFTPDQHHPFRVSQLRKHNPMQRFAYLWVKLCINPVIWVSGLLYLYYKDPAATTLVRASGVSLGTVALVHTAAAFCMLIFVIVHVYFATTGHTPLAYIKAMITGWEEVDADPVPSREHA